MTGSRTVDDDDVVRVIAHELLDLPEHEEIIDAGCRARDDVDYPQPVQLPREDPQAATLQVLGKCRAGGEREEVGSGNAAESVLLAVDFDEEDAHSGTCGNCRKRA